MKNLTKTIIDLIELTLIGVLVFVLIYLFTGQLLEITGDSMEPNYHNKEQILAEKVSTKLQPPRRGEVIVFISPQDSNKLLIKRVIGLPGEKVKISNGNVYINGKKLNETYLASEAKTAGGKAIIEDTEYAIEPNSYVVMGDNRGFSNDSRNWGSL